MTGINPFENNIVHEPRAIEKSLTGLNDVPLNQLLHQFARLESDSKPRRIRAGHAQFVISPQPGYGKSHLIGRLFKKLNQRATRIYLLPFQDASACWKTILLKIVQEMSFPDSASVQSADTDAPTQLEAFAHGIIIHLLMDAVACGGMRSNPDTLAFMCNRPFQEIRRNRSWLAWLRHNEHQFKLQLSKQAARYGFELNVSAYSWLSVLLMCAFPLQYELKAACLDWLKGGSLDVNEARRIGVRPADIPNAEMSLGETSQLCLQRIADFCQLAGFFRPFLFCFDQTEIFSRNAEGAKEFGAVIMTLADWPNQMTLVTANQTPWSAGIRPHWHDAQLQRLSQPIELEALNRDQALELIEQRFEGLDMDHAKHRFSGDYQWMDELNPTSGSEMGIRTFLDDCNKRWLSLAGETPLPVTIEALYNKNIQKIKAEPKRLVFDPDILRWLVRDAANGADGIVSANYYVSPKGYVTLMWRMNGQTRYFGFESGSHWRRWQAIAWEAVRLCRGASNARVVFFRSPELDPIPGAWKIADQIQTACRTCLHIMVLTRSELAELYAGYDLYLEAESGDIPFQANEVLVFLRDALAPFWQKIQTSTNPPAPHGDRNPEQSPDRIQDRVQAQIVRVPPSPGHSQHSGNPLQGPINVCTRDYERGRKAHGIPVGVFTQNSHLPKGFAVFSGATGFGEQFNPDHKAPAAHLFDNGAVDSSQAGQKIGSL